MSKERILTVDDEKDILELVRYNLEKEGYLVTGVSSGEAAIEELARETYGIVVLDLMLPGIDGFEVIRKMKRSAKTDSVPVIILSAKGEDADIVAGLELGADDYVTKPFSPKVLVARIRATLRRGRKFTAKSGGEIRIRSICIDPAKRHVSVEGSRVELTSTEFKILHFLAQQPGWVFTRGQLINAVKGEDYPATDRSIDVQIASLRKKLGRAGADLETVHGVGYRFKES